MEGRGQGQELCSEGEGASQGLAQCRQEASLDEQGGEHVGVGCLLCHVVDSGRVWGGEGELVICCGGVATLHSCRRIKKHVCQVSRLWWLGMEQMFMGVRGYTRAQT